jgi:hypothetical protein
MKRFVMLGVVILTATCFGADGSGSGSKEQPNFKMTARKDDDSMEAKMEKDIAIVVVNSASGISAGTIERQDEKWPEKVVLRMKLKGMESFNVSNGKVALNAAVSSPLKVRQWKDGKESDELDAKSEYWMDIRALSAEGKPVKQIPLADGYFEVALPKAFFEGNPKSITLKWIDFHR